MKPGDTQSSEEVLKFDQIYCDLLTVHYFHTFVFFFDILISVVGCNVS